MEAASEHGVTRGQAWTEATKYRTLADSIDEGFCVIEALFDERGKGNDYRFLEINPSFERQTGLSDAVGRRIRELVPAHEPFWFEVYGDVARTGVSQRFEHQAEALSRWYDVFAFPVGRPEDRWVGVLFNDISDRVAAQRELRRSDERKNDFMALVAHELRNPLQPMMSALRLLDMGRADPAVVDKARDIIARQVNRMAALIDDLGDIGRISRGDLPMQMSLVDLRETAQHAREVAEPAIIARDHALTVDLPDEAVCVAGDANRLSQALTNLLVNAAKYTGKGGRIALRLAQEGDEAVIEVTDTGIGIAPDELEGIFGLYQQLPSGRKLSQGGLGIGLALVRQIVELHGGSVSAASEGVGRGSVFTIRLGVQRV